MVWIKCGQLNQIGRAEITGLLWWLRREGFLLQFIERTQRADVKNGIDTGRLRYDWPIRVGEQHGQRDK